MRFPALIPYLLAASLFSLMVALPFVPDSSAPGFFRFEVTMRSAEPAIAQVYWDDGHGIAEVRSTRQLVPANQETALHFALPSERLVALRFDPLNRPGECTISRPRIASRDGRTIREIPLAHMVAQQQIEGFTIEGETLRLTTVPGANDPIIALPTFEPLDLSRISSGGGGAFLKRAGLVFALLCILGLLGPRIQERWTPGSRIHGWFGWLTQHPRGAIAVVAVGAVVLSSYPVIFLGKSFVSPSLGVALLYPGVPTLPGMTSTTGAEVKAADVGAIMWQHVPLSMQQRDALVEGELPLWNRYNSAGVALFGQGQSSLGDPFNLLPMLAGGASWAWDLKFLLAKWLLGCGVGLAVWSLTRDRPAALLAAASAPFIGFFVYRVNHPAIFSLCYAPWVLVAWQGAIAADTRRQLAQWAAVWLLVNLTLLCSGTAKEAVMLLLWLNVAGALLLLFAPQPWSLKAVRGAALVLAGVAFLLIAAPHWLLFLDTLRHSFTAYDNPRAYQLPPGLFVGLFDEIFYRPFQHAGGVINPSANFLTLLGLSWLAVRWRAAWMHRGVRALLLAAVVPALLVFGIIPPAWITAVPGLAGIMHVDNTFACVLLVLALVLAGWGWQESARRLSGPEGRAEAIVVLLLVLGAIAVHYGTAQAILRSMISQHSWGLHTTIDPWTHRYVLSLIGAVVLGLVVLRRRLMRGRWTGPTALLAVLCLLALHWRHGFHAQSGNPHYVVVPTERANLLAHSPSVAALQAATAQEPARVAGLGETLFPGWTGAYRLEGLSGPDALANRYYRELLLNGGVPQLWDWRYILEGPSLPALRPLLDALNVAYIVVPWGDPFAGGGNYELLLEADLNLYRSTTVWPRAFFVDRLAAYHGLGELYEWIRQAEGRPLAAVSQAEIPANVARGNLAARTTTPASDYRLTTNTTAFTIDAPSAGVAVLTEAFVPGSFRVTVNDRPATYFRVNHAFKGVVLPAAGRYRIAFTYRPPISRIAIGLSATGLVLACAALWFARHPRPLTT